MQRAKLARRVKLGPRLLISAVGLSLIASACTTAATPAAAFKLPMQLTPSNASWAVAKDQGFLKGIDLDYQLVGYGESAQLFVSGQNPVGQESPWEAAVFQDKGEDISYFGTASASNFISAIIIRAEDASKYKSLTDLKGKKIGIPGFGTGTWAAFQVLAKGLYNLDPKGDFVILEGDPGTVMGLLQTKQVDGAIPFTAGTFQALANPGLKAIFEFSAAWKTKSGSGLTIDGQMARRSWLDSHQEIAKNLVAGLDQGLQYLKDNPAIVNKGGKYEAFWQNAGFLSDDTTYKSAVDQLKSGNYQLLSTTFTKDWTDDVYEFIALGKGVLAPTIPPKEKVFYLPMLK
jgi:ABC-type nitrate/sulfonate/bicarbonate transport system substrate-binding protein